LWLSHAHGPSNHIYINIARVIVFDRLSRGTVERKTSRVPFEGFEGSTRRRAFT
jgi:hypothetical protein